MVQAHRPSSTVRVILLVQRVWDEEEEDPIGEQLTLSVNPGCSGGGRSMISLLSIDRTVDMVGLFTGDSWTHSSPMWMHLMISARKLELHILLSIRSKALSSFHNFHAFKKKVKNVRLSLRTKNSFSFLFSFSL